MAKGTESENGKGWGWCFFFAASCYGLRSNLPAQALPGFVFLCSISLRTLGAKNGRSRSMGQTRGKWMCTGCWKLLIHFSIFTSYKCCAHFPPTPHHFLTGVVFAQKRLFRTEELVGWCHRKSEENLCRELILWRYSAFYTLPLKLAF